MMIFPQVNNTVTHENTWYATCKTCRKMSYVIFYDGLESVKYINIYQTITKYLIKNNKQNHSERAASDRKIAYRGVYKID